MTFRDILEAFRRCNYTLEAIKQSSLRLCCLLSLSKDPPYTCSKPAQYKMPEVVRGIRSHEGAPGPLSRQETPTSPLSNHRVTFEQEATSSPVRHTASHESRKRRQSLNLSERAESDAYYDSRAATKKEFRRRASTLQEYYREHPTLLPQLPFTWHHGWKRYRLGLFVTFMFLDACVVPIVLYYGMNYGGHVQGWIIFAVVTTIWGGPTYVEFAIRSWRLMKKEHFYRPLGQTSRWKFDIVHWTCVIVITAVTALFIVGSAPHIVFLRVLSMPGPAILYSMGGVLFAITMWSLSGRKAPFRISSTPKGGEVYPGVYYFIEDVVAVNANAGRPFREALAARYEASARFRRMIWVQSLFWSIPPIVLAIPLTVIACIHSVPATVAYGICEFIPFPLQTYASSLQ
jgi:hypothetical protein